MNNSFKVSIIIPIYNAEKHLDYCLDSVLKQTYQNLEILLIDNGSSDKSRNICNRYIQLDKRFKLLTEVSRGVSKARNMGLKHYTGEYCLFIDADDFVEDCYVEKLLTIVIKYNTPLAYCKEYICKDNGIMISQTYNNIIPIKINVYDEYSFASYYAHYMVWGVIFKREIIEDLYFAEDLFVGEDTLFFAMALKRCKEIVFLNEPLYYYVQYDVSSSHGKYDEKKHTEISAWIRICETFYDYPLRFKIDCNAELGIRCKKNLYILIQQSRRKCYYWDKLLEIMKENLGDVLLSSLSLKNKLAYVGACIVPNSYFTICKFLKL